MTEAEWLTCDRILSMDLALRSKRCLWKRTTRKLRLFACGICRRVWHLLPTEADRHAIELAEKVADKELRMRDLAEAHAKCTQISLGIDELLRGNTSQSWVNKSLPDVRSSVWVTPSGEMIARPSHWASMPTAWIDPHATADDIAALLYYTVGPQAAEKERAAHCQLLRDVVGPPRGKMPTNDPYVLAWNSGTVVKLAQAIYEERAFDRLPILADALEDAGCTNRDIIDHCRLPGEHVRGCWVVDLILGKE